ncbi:LysR family transcriptional regulator [Actinophytocola sp.]|uniref:LysR family transcriptional regulator n=1 Tax=Actinophytocola sp. TaxID=1872138 RepID=UPI002ED41463
MGARVELRDIEIFLILAEELHFGRTAERLHISQARVSQAIKAQERRIGAPLFHRTSRRVRLTPIGEQLHRDLSAGYQQIMTGVAAATAAASGHHGHLTLGSMGPQPWAINQVIDLFQTRTQPCGCTTGRSSRPRPSNQSTRGRWTSDWSGYQSATPTSPSAR